MYSLYITYLNNAAYTFMGSRGYYGVCIHGDRYVYSFAASDNFALFLTTLTESGIDFTDITFHRRVSR